MTLIGLTNGCVYALVALGYTLVYGILELINFAHGDVFMLGGMFAITYSTELFGLQEGQGWVTVPIFFVTLVLAMLSCGSINATIEFVAYRPLRQRAAPRAADHRDRRELHHRGHRPRLEGPELRDRAGRVPALERLLDRRRRRTSGTT